jgi:hypothetical protein
MMDITRGMKWLKQVSGLEDEINAHIPPGFLILMRLRALKTFWI